MKNEKDILKNVYGVDALEHKKPRGIVFAFGDNGELVFHKENMITKSGRKWIIDNGFNENTITEAIAGDNTNMTTPDSDISSMGNTIKATIESRQFTESNFEYKFQIKISSTEAKNVSCIGLLCNNGGTLFSRLVFPTYNLSPSSSLQINYYVYF